MKHLLSTSPAMSNDSPKPLENASQIPLGLKDMSRRRFMKIALAGAGAATSMSGCENMGDKSYSERPNIDLGVLDLGDGVSCTGRVVFEPFEYRLGKQLYFTNIVLEVTGLPGESQFPHESKISFGVSTEYLMDKPIGTRTKTFVGGFPGPIDETLRELQKILDKNPGDSEKEDQWLQGISTDANNVKALEAGTPEENRVRYLAIMRKAVPIAQQQYEAERKSQEISND